MVKSKGAKKVTKPRKTRGELFQNVLRAWRNVLDTTTSVSKMDPMSSFAGERLDTLRMYISELDRALSALAAEYPRARH